MKIVTLTYRRVKNLGNYESESLEAIAQIPDDEDVDEALEDLKEWVELKLGVFTQLNEGF